MSSKNKMIRLTGTELQNHIILFLMLMIVVILIWLFGLEVALLKIPGVLLMPEYLDYFIQY